MEESQALKQMTFDTPEALPRARYQYLMEVGSESGVLFRPYPGPSVVLFLPLPGAMGGKLPPIAALQTAKCRHLKNHGQLIVEIQNANRLH